MNAIFLTLFVSLVLVAGAVLLFAAGFAQRDHEHATRLSLLPLEEDAHPPASPDAHARASSPPEEP